jgi:exonuclease SbcD
VLKILHTSDWHLGRQFQGLSLYEDHELILEQVVAALQTHKPNVLIIAGDLFDRAAPPASAVRQFNQFITRARSGNEVAIVIIAGNHDSGDRIASMGVFAAGGEPVLVRGPLDPIERPLIVQDDAGPVAISALPFGYEYAARECFGQEDIDCPAKVIAAQIAAARSQVPPGARWVVVAHAFVEGANNTESERSLGRTIGGIETIPSSIFGEANYVALGHLHRAQAAGADHIRYSGSPLAFGFDEAEQLKSMTLVELDAEGAVSCEFIPFHPRRQVRRLKGHFSELIAAKQSDDIVQIVLTDPEPLIDPMKRLREVYPNAVHLTYQRDLPGDDGYASSEAPSMDTPHQLIARFLHDVRGDGMSEREEALISNAILSFGVTDSAQ